MVLCEGARDTDAATRSCLGADVMIESDLVRCLAARGAVGGAALTLTPSTFKASGGRNVGGSAAGPQAFGSMRMTSHRATALPSWFLG